MIPEGMTQPEANVELQKMRREVIDSFGGREHSSAETNYLLKKRWMAFCGVEWVEPVSETPLPPPPEVSSPVPMVTTASQPVTPTSVPQPVAAGVTPAPPKTTAPVAAAQEGQPPGQWTSEKAPDVDTLAAQAAKAPAPASDRVPA